MVASENLLFLGMDYGTKKIGVAVGQTLTATANPLSPVSVKMGTPHWEQIATIITKWRPRGIVVGIPLNMDASSQTMTKRARKFAAELRDKFSLPVYEMDERLTTVEARQQLFELGGYKALKETSVDCFAAKLILEAWLRTTRLGES